MKKKTGLGKGLDVLFEDNSAIDNPVCMINLSDIEPNKDQPRHIFNEAPLAELADSIKEHGIIQPLMVRPLHNGRYQIVAGERRWRASRMAGLTQVPVIIRELSPSATMEIALIENLQREDLNPIEEALGYEVLSTEHSMTQEQIAKRVGKSRPVVANALRLLKLPTPVLDGVRKGDISQGHARALLSIDNEEKILQIALDIVKKGLTVRDVEKISQNKEHKIQKDKKDTNSSWGDSYTKEVELALQEELNTKVRINKSGSKGVLEIEFYSQEQLTSIAQLLSKGI